MKRRTRQLAAAFAITLILIMGLCGFVAVDLSTERYMPSDHAPMFRLEALDSEGARFDVLGKSCIIESAALTGALELLWRCRGLLPRGVLEAGALTAKSYVAVRDYAESLEPPADPW